MTEPERTGLLTLTHPPEWHARREGKITGTTAAQIMRGDVMEAWKLATGRREQDDLSRIVLVQLGTVTQPLNAHFYELETGVPVTEYETWQVHPEIPWMACNKDGMAGTKLWEAKYTAGRKTLPEMVDFYMGQLVHNAIIARAHDPSVDGWVLSVLTGYGELWIQAGDIDPFYADILLEREARFRDCVQSDTPPLDIAPVAAPVPQSEWRTVDMSFNNEWGAFADDWLSNKAAAAKFNKAVKGIKDLIEPDVGLAMGAGLQAKRSKNGSIRIREIDE